MQGATQEDQPVWFAHESGQHEGRERVDSAHVGAVGDTSIVDDSTKLTVRVDTLGQCAGLLQPGEIGVDCPMHSVEHGMVLNAQRVPRVYDVVVALSDQHLGRGQTKTGCRTGDEDQHDRTIVLAVRSQLAFRGRRQA